MELILDHLDRFSEDRDVCLSALSLLWSLLVDGEALLPRSPLPESQEGLYLPSLEHVRVTLATEGRQTGRVGREGAQGFLSSGQSLAPEVSQSWMPYPDFHCRIGGLGPALPPPRYCTEQRSKHGKLGKPETPPSPRSQSPLQAHWQGEAPLSICPLVPALLGGREQQVGARIQ